MYFEVDIGGSIPVQLRGSDRPGVIPVNLLTTERLPLQLSTAVPSGCPQDTCDALYELPIIFLPTFQPLVYLRLCSVTCYLNNTPLLIMPPPLRTTLLNLGNLQPLPTRSPHAPSPEDDELQMTNKPWYHYMPLCRASSLSSQPKVYD